MSRTGTAWATVCAALAGFVSLSHEILWYRIYTFGTGGTLPVFGISLGIYLAGMAVSNGQVKFNAKRFEAALRTHRIDGHPLFNGPAAPWLEANLLRLPSPNNLETCPSILARTKAVRIITDDDLAAEASVPWNFSFRPPQPE